MGGGECVLHKVDESPMHEEASLNAAKTIPRKRIKRDTARSRAGQRDGPGGQINHLSDRLIISAGWYGKVERGQTRESAGLVNAKTLADECRPLERGYSV